MSSVGIFPLEAGLRLLPLPQPSHHLGYRPGAPSMHHLWETVPGVVRANASLDMFVSPCS